MVRLAPGHSPEDGALVIVTNIPTQSTLTARGVTIRMHSRSARDSVLNLSDYYAARLACHVDWPVEQALTMVTMHDLLRSYASAKARKLICVSRGTAP